MWSWKTINSKAGESESPEQCLSSDKSQVSSQPFPDELPYICIPIKRKSHCNAKIVGRKRFKEKLESTLKRALERRNGAFLVGGYRGVGKTYLLEKVIESIREEKFFFKPEVVKIDLGVDSSLSTRDILFDLCESLYEKSVVRKQFFNLFFSCIAFLTIVLPIAIYQDVAVLQVNDFFDLEYRSIDRLKVYPILMMGLFLLAGLGTYALSSLYNKVTSHSYLRELVFSARYSREWENSASINDSVLKSIVVNRRDKKKQEPLSARRMQLQIKEYFKRRSESIFPIKQHIVIFDEVDKINPTPIDKLASDSKTRKQKTDELLGGLKGLFSDSACVYVVVAGREIVDAYYSESGYTSVLYESVFDDIFYIPTLLTDWSDGVQDHYSSMVRKYVNEFIFGSESQCLESLLHDREVVKSEKEKAQRMILDTIFYFELFIRYLTLHSWGNFKRLRLMLQDHVEVYSDHLAKRVEGRSLNLLPVGKGDRVLLFTPSDIRRMFVSARLYSLFEVNLGRVTSKTDDKAAVSSLITILDLFRFHSRGFSRPMLDRTVAGIDIHAEASLAHIADDYLHSTYSSMIRRTSNNLFPYRFFLSTDLEFSYFAKLLGAKSSSFEFALDSSDPVKEFYNREATRQAPGNSINSFLSQAKLQSILGDIATSEHHYDQATSHYSNALYLLKKTLRLEDESDWRNSGGISLEAQYMLIRTLFKKGILEEERENSRKAISIYTEAQKVAFLMFEQTSLLRGSTNNKIGDWKFLDSKVSKDKYHCFDEVILAQLAIDFVEVKTGKRNRLEAFERYSFESDKLGGKEKFRFLPKYLLTAYYSGYSNTLIENSDGHGLVNEGIAISLATKEHEYSLVSNASSISYTWGHAMFSLLAKKIKDDIDDEPKCLCGIWIELLPPLVGFDKHISDSTFIDNLDGSDEKVSLLIHSIYYIFQAADESKKRGRYAEAAHQYTSIVLNWVALLEILPWRSINKTADKKTKNDFIKVSKELAERVPIWLEDVIKCAQDCVEKSDRSANVSLRESVLNRYRAENNFDLGEFNNELRITDVLDTLADGNAQKKLPAMVWCRSNISNYLLSFCIWEHYCRYSIRQWCIAESPQCLGDDKPTFNIDALPRPMGNLPRVAAIFSWVYARYKMHDLKTRIQDKTFNLIDDAEEVVELVSNLVESLDEYKKAFRSDEPDSFPSKAHIYFNLYELSQQIDNIELKEKLPAELNIDEPNVPLKYIIHRCHEKQKRGFEAFNKGANPSSRHMGTYLAMHLDENYLKTHLKKNAHDLSEISNCESNAFKRKLRHKYFLYDDFDDPFYISEWSYIRMMSSTAKLLAKDFDKDKVDEKISPLVCDSTQRE